ncbi:MAG: hypothetical protein ACE5JP_10625 [Candidatus Bipolaricaulia bacterium]
MTDILDLSEQQVRCRIHALGSLLDPYRECGSHNRILIRSEGLELLEKLEFYLAPGRTIHHAVEHLRDEIEGSNVHRPLPAPPKPLSSPQAPWSPEHMSSELGLESELVDQMKDWIGYLKNQIERLHEEKNQLIQQMLMVKDYQIDRLQTILHHQFAKAELGQVTQMLTRALLSLVGKEELEQVGDYLKGGGVDAEVAVDIERELNEVIGKDDRLEDDYIAKDGHRCDSKHEKQIDDYLYEKVVPHIREPRYPWHPKLNPGTPNSDLTEEDWALSLYATWKVGRVFIEYFPRGHPKLEREIEQKHQLAKETGIELIAIYSEDMENSEWQEKLRPLTEKGGWRYRSQSRGQGRGKRPKF